MKIYEIFQSSFLRFVLYGAMKLIVLRATTTTTTTTIGSTLRMMIPSFTEAYDVFQRKSNMFVVLLRNLILQQSSYYLLFVLCKLIIVADSWLDCVPIIAEFVKYTLLKILLKFVFELVLKKVVNWRINRYIDTSRINTILSFGQVDAIEMYEPLFYMMVSIIRGMLFEILKYNEIIERLTHFLPSFVWKFKRVVENWSIDVFNACYTLLIQPADNRRHQSLV